MRFCAIALLLASCASPDYEVCGAEVYSCEGFLDAADLRIAIDAVGAEMHEQGELPSANLCQFAGELTITCTGEAYDREPAQYSYWPAQLIEVHEVLNQDKRIAVVAHELVHWAVEELLGSKTNNHALPYFQGGATYPERVPRDESVAAHAIARTLLKGDEL